MYNYKGKPLNVHRAILSLLIFLLFPIASQAEDGTQNWAVETEGMIKSSPAIGSDGTIYVGSEDSNLYAINPDGNLKWKFETTRYSYVTCSPAIGYDGTIYVGSWDRNFYAITPEGTLKWVFCVENYVHHSSPAISSDGTIYIGTYGTTGNKYLFAINSNGTLKWKFQIGDEIESSPAIGSDGTIYVGANDNYLYAINPNGTMKWKFLSTGNVGSSPAIGSDGTIYVGSNDKNLYAINPNGTMKWKFLTTDDIESSPAIGSDGTIYVGSNDKNLYAINPNGTMKWAFLTDGSVRSSPAIGSDGIIYIKSGLSYDYLYAINPDGTLKWECLTDTSWVNLSSPAIASDGTIYVGSWYSIYSINSSSGGLASSPWPMFRHNLRHTGNVLIPIPPTVTTDPATSVTSTSATLNGTVNPNGSDTTYYFEYGADTSYGLTTETIIAGSGTIAISVNENISDLNPDDTYHYRIRATNNFGTSYGSDRMFYAREKKAMPWIPLLLLDD